MILLRTLHRDIARYNRLDDEVLIFLESNLFIFRKMLKKNLDGNLFMEMFLDLHVIL